MLPFDQEVEYEGEVRKFACKYDETLYDLRFRVEMSFGLIGGTSELTFMTEHFDTTDMHPDRLVRDLTHRGEDRLRLVPQG